ncbi:MAG: hypothetical protein H7329_04595, partial [Opitutaceae bacterium]|nr:hypothetical protein [Cytophagales bacterium]
MELEWDGKAQEFIDANQKGITFPIQKEAVAVLQNMITSIKEKNIEVILIFPPEYVAIRPFIKNREQIMGIFKALAKNNNIEFWDYSDHPMCSQKKNFYNSEHLKGSAAIEFSKSFAYDLKAYLDGKQTGFIEK